jgi:hypothetical protein
MKAIALLLLFIGMFLVVQGYYTKTNTCPPPQVEVKYIPRSLYEEQLSDDPPSLVSTQFKSMFEDTDPLITLRRG